jgi:hypothetical protein
MVYRPVGEFSDRPPRVLCAELRDGKHQPTHVLADNHCALAIDTTFNGGAQSNEMPDPCGGSGGAIGDTMTHENPRSTLGANGTKIGGHIKDTTANSTKSVFQWRFHSHAICRRLS